MFPPCTELTAEQNPTWLQRSCLASASPPAAAATVQTPALCYWWECNEKGDQSTGHLLEWSHCLVCKLSDANRELPAGWSEETCSVTPLSDGCWLPDCLLVSTAQEKGRGGYVAQIWGHPAADVKSTMGEGDVSFTEGMTARNLWNSWFKYAINAKAQILP